MIKRLILFFLLIPVLGYSQYKFTFTDSLGVIREVSYKYPLPIEIRLPVDTTKFINYNNGRITVPFPMKLYNDLIDLTKKITKA